MKTETIRGVHIDATVLKNYFAALVNLLFKILPMREGGEKTLGVYMDSLQLELLGCYELFPELKADSGMLSIICILQCLINHPEYPVAKVRREVFHAISICKRMEGRFAEVQNGNMG